MIFPFQVDDSLGSNVNFQGCNIPKKGIGII